LKPVRSRILFQELDASNGIGTDIDSEQVRQVGHSRDVSKAVLAKLQVLEVLILLKSRAQILYGGISLFHGKRSESVRASIMSALDAREASH